jgi:hypothetical protein
MDNRMIDNHTILDANDKLHGLETSPLYWFSAWPNAAVPRSGSIVYSSGIEQAGSYMSAWPGTKARHVMD